MGLSLVFAAVLAMGGRSDLLRTVRGDPDERGVQVVVIRSPHRGPSDQAKVTCALCGGRTLAGESDQMFDREAPVH